MPFVVTVPTIKLFQWDGKDASLMELQTYVAGLHAARPWADAGRTQAPDQLAVSKNADGSLHIANGTASADIPVGSWIGEIEPGPNGGWRHAIYPDTYKQHKFQ